MQIVIFHLFMLLRLLLQDLRRRRRRGKRRRSLVTAARRERERRRRAQSLDFAVSGNGSSLRWAPAGEGYGHRGVTGLGEGDERLGGLDLVVDENHRHLVVWGNEEGIGFWSGLCFGFGYIGEIQEGGLGFWHVSTGWRWGFSFSSFLVSLSFLFLFFFWWWFYLFLSF